MFKKNSGTTMIKKLSVIVPVYNTAQYLRQCMDSLISQTLSDIEIICVDDGSTDTSAQILQEYADRYEHIHLILSEHIGTGACRNLAVEKAQGQYLGFVDPDDYIESTYFEKLYNSAIENNSDVVCQLSRIEFDNVSGIKKELCIKASNTDLEFRYNIISDGAHLWSKIFNRDFIVSNKIRNALTKRSQDLLFSMPAILAADTISVVSDAKYFYRKGHNSVCQSEFSENDIKEQCLLYQDIMTKIDELAPNMRSLVILKQQTVLKSIYNKLSEDDRAEMAKYLQNINFIDFALPTDSNINIALKIPAPDSFKKIWWGDYWLGLDLISGLKEVGCSARIDYAEDFNKSANENTNIVMRGLKPFFPKDYSKLNILYIISRFNTISDYEISRYDCVLVGSETIAQQMQKKHKNVFFVPQFTNTDRFFPEYDARYAHDVLFVGNAYAGVRPVVKMALESGLDISVFGNFWNNKIDDKYIKGIYIDNSELHKYYSSAKINLNDTTETMKANGFISNRIYDVTACGGFIISDYIPEIADVYGDAIPMYKNATELKELVDYYLAHPQERQEKAKRAYEITIRRFTHLVFAQTLQSEIFSRFIFSNKSVAPVYGRKNNHILSDIMSYILFPYYWFMLHRLRRKSKHII